ncbi:YqaJ domain-containing protein [Pseudoscourfieldia marina]
MPSASSSSSMTRRLWRSFSVFGLRRHSSQQQQRFAFTAAVSSSSSSSSSSPFDDHQRNHLLRAIEYESKNNYTNIQGKEETFAHFMYNKLGALEHPLASEFQFSYANSTPSERTRLCEDLKRMLFDAETPDIHRSTMPQQSQVPSDNLWALSTLTSLTPLRGGTWADQDQGSATWHALRDARITASDFANAVGHFGMRGKLELWKSKLGLAEPFRGNAATRHGSASEPLALKAYEEQLQVSVQTHVAFQTLGEDLSESWLGASPDGLLTDGLLEIKCPWNRGSPELMKPWDTPPPYYVPQIQGQMEVFDREYVHLLCYTPNHGCKVFRFERDRAYWENCYSMLASFWWQHVVPARMAKERGFDVDEYAPQESPEETRRRCEMDSYARKIVMDAEVVHKW